MLIASMSDSYEIDSLRLKISQGKLPKWCYYTQTNEGWNTARSKKLIKKFGKGWIHMHHYCYGLDRMHKAFDKGAQYKYFDSALISASKELDYVLNNTKNDFPLKPYIYLKKGDILRLADKTAKALQSYHRAIQVNPQFVQGYVALSNVYKDNHNHEKAIEIISMGLRYNSDSNILKSILKKLQ